MAFVYRRRSEESVEKRASGESGDFKGFILNDYSMFSPKKGNNWIRILPPTWDDADHYGLDLHVHYGVGPERALVLCWSHKGVACPICEAQNRAQRAGDEELAKELKASQRLLVWVLDRNEKEKGPLLWAMPWTIDRDICKISKDKQTGELYAIDHPDEGYNVSFDKDGEGLKTKYSGFQLDRRSSSVDPVHLEYISNHPLPGTLLERTYQEVKLLFEGAPTPGEQQTTPSARRSPPPADDPRRAASESTREANDRALGGDDIPWDKMDKPGHGEDAPQTGSTRRAPPPAEAAGDKEPGQLSEAQKRAAAMRERFGKK